MRKSDSIKGAWDEASQALQTFEEEFSERNKLIDRVSTGELTPDEADRIAAEQGLEPIRQKPDASEYDPRSQMTWSIPMTVAWIATGNDDEVRGQWDEYRQKCTFWDDQSLMGPSGETYERVLIPRRSASLFAYLTIGLEAETAKRKQAYNQLRNALYESKLGAEGTDSKGHRAPIPAHLWSTLEFTSTGRSPEFRSRNSAEQYDHVRVAASKVIEIWPAPKSKTHAHPKVDWRELWLTIEQAYKKRVATWPKNKAAPSENEDWYWAREEFGIPRQEFREIRRAHAPKDWLKSGPRR